MDILNKRCVNEWCGYGITHRKQGLRGKRKEKGVSSNGKRLIYYIYNPIEFLSCVIHVVNNPEFGEPHLSHFTMTTATPFSQLIAMVYGISFKVYSLTLQSSSVKADI